MQILPIPLISKKNACTVIVQKTIVSSQGKSHKWKNIYINNTISAYIDCTSIVIIGADLASSAIKHLGFCLISNAIKYFYSFRLLDLQHRPSCRDLLVFGVYQWFKEGKHIDHSLSKIKSKKKKKINAALIWQSENESCMMAEPILYTLMQVLSLQVAQSPTSNLLQQSQSELKKTKYRVFSQLYSQ